MWGVAKQEVEGGESRQAFVVVCAHCQQPHVGSKVPVRGHDEEVYFLHLGLRSLLKEAVVYNSRVWVHHKKEKNGNAFVEGKHGHDLLLQGVSDQGSLGAVAGLLRRAVRVRVSHLMDEHHVSLYKVGVVPGTQVVCYHEAGELVSA